MHIFSIRWFININTIYWPSLDGQDVITHNCQMGDLYNVEAEVTGSSQPVPQQGRVTLRRGITVLCDCIPEFRYAVARASASRALRPVRTSPRVHCAIRSCRSGARHVLSRDNARSPL